MDQSRKQLIGAKKVPVPVSKGQPKKHNCEYLHHGVCNIYIAREPLAGKRMVTITERKT